MASSAGFAVLLVLAVAAQCARGMHNCTYPCTAASTLKPFHFICYILDYLCTREYIKAVNN